MEHSLLIVTYDAVKKLVAHVTILSTMHVVVTHVTKRDQILDGVFSLVFMLLQGSAHETE